MLKQRHTLTDQELVNRVRDADPLAKHTPDVSDADAATLLARVLSEPRRPQRRRPRGSARTALVAAVAAAALLVPAAVAFHRQLFDAFEDRTQPADPYDLEGTWRTTVAGLRPDLNGRWTLRFTLYRNRPGFIGTYSRSRNGKLVAAGTMSFNYTPLGGMVGLRDMSGPSQCSERMIGGAYVVEIRKKVLTLKPLTAPTSDSCRARRAVLADRPFRR